MFKRFFLVVPRILFFFIGISIFSGCKEKFDYIPNTLRAPAYPLVTIDTYTNGWLFGDTLYKEQICHNTGRKFPLLGLIRVDGKNFRFMGNVENAIYAPLADVSEQGEWEGKYTFVEPDKNWISANYDDDKWATGKGAFGYFDINKVTPIVRTSWKGQHIWVRRELTLEEDLAGKEVYLQFSNDDAAEIYINGVEVVNTGNVVKMNERIKLSDEVVATLRKGKNIMAAHCMNRMRNAIIDFGLSVSQPVFPSLEQTATQKSVEVQPTQTIYTFTCDSVNLKLTFTAPLLMNDLELLSRPVNYISYEVISKDAKKHDVELYFEAGPEWSLSSDYQECKSESFEKDNLVFLKTGSVAQEVLNKRTIPYIDWGYFYLVSKKTDTYSGVGDYCEMRTDFCSKGFVKKSQKKSPNKKNHIAVSHSLGKVKDSKSGFVMLGYDDVYSVQYFGQKLRPYWNRSADKNILQMFELAEKEYKKIQKQCNQFDVEMLNYASKCGGKEYAELCALAYRQSVSAHKLLEAPNGDLLFLSHTLEKTATVDVTYPSAPLFLLYNVELLKAMLNPIFHYVENENWNYPFAPHDIGEYPYADGQTSDYYRLPVEESGNMLILTAAIASMEGNADYAKKHWNTLSKWADYLFNEGFDPAKQLSTDVFAGYTTHDTNLSIKAILGIASYARLADMLGKNEIAKKYSMEARSLALKWTKMADNGDYYRFAFDQPDTWSQKYNLVWDKIMKIDVFPHEVREKEVAHYLKKQNEYGLPLDSRHLYTKADWIVWSATLSPNIETFQEFIILLHKYVDETPVRRPMADWYWTNTFENPDFHARSVVGAFFIKMMEDKLINK